MNKNSNKHLLIDDKDKEQVLILLEQEYSDAKCGLNYSSALELTIALILAAQSKDERVNKIVPILFKTYPTLEELAKADINEISKIIKPCGFYHTKASNISKTANKLLNEYNRDCSKFYGRTLKT